jgi:hypothetical protein
MSEQPELARHELEQQVAESLINSRGHPEAIDYLHRIIAFIELDQEKSLRETIVCPTSRSLSYATRNKT